MASSEAELALFLTRIIDFKVAPQRPVIDEKVIMTGILQYKHLVWGWRPYGGAPVKSIIDGEIREEQKTKKETGSFGFTWYPHRKAIYWVKVRFDGSPLDHPCESPEVKVEAITEEEREEEDQRMLLLIGGGAGLGLLAVGAVVYTYDRQRQYEMLMLAR